MIININDSSWQANKHPVETSHSIVIVLQRVHITEGYSFHQCEQGQTVNHLSFQHFCTCCGNMKAVARDCISHHYEQTDLSPIPSGGGTTRLHQIVLNADLTCKISNIPLSTVAYRFCLTQATPVCIPLDESQDMLKEWCATLELAKQSALEIIDNIAEEKE